ncbi:MULTISPECIES: hypothetical protein [unclassified Rhizobium]|jgi:hypothetical protein|uniref:hypothetical protein n=1 Tax=unclassified Rhizobium TaxID=2613769 RepID=UPI0013AE946F|nr:MULTISPECIES: hypothetical protein [unclassified Rhizobium]MBB3290933.1 hypothetical protein [Rhizobium sp. BK252]MBB3405762.1 hypothetical protein [Rhizobium sp. BK289]MBB3418310.1 hypothetical protein [Rhizobium sp. BK284]MBB3486139.1 hypothetical protein [Rhizobium sp. BK347]MDK4722948.1 hypothetical protein [Rhizobium sp. CNPSo 3968]
MNFGTQTAILIAILELSEFDYCGLYETYWLVPDGDIHNPQLNISKICSLNEIIELNYNLCKKGYAELILFQNGEPKRCKDISNIKYDRNYTPFSMTRDTGYGLSTTETGAELLHRLKARALKN